MLLGDLFPNFTADSTIGPMKFHHYLGDSWGILFSHPADFTPVCTTELSSAAKMADAFTQRNTKLAAISCDSVDSHNQWIDDLKCYGSLSEEKFPFPIIADEKRELAVQLGMLDPDEKDSKGLPLTARAVFVIGPDKKLKLSLLYPATTGRCFKEVLRALDSLQLTAAKKVATPANWDPGNDVMIVPSVSDAEAKQLFPKHTVHELPSQKNYLRITPDS